MSTDTAESPQTPSAIDGPHAVQLCFWQKPWAQNVLPLVTSVVFHLALVVIGIATYQAARVITSVAREQVIIPEAAIVEGAEVGGIPNPGLGGDPNLSAAQNVDPNITAAAGWADRRSDTLAGVLLGAGGSEDAADSVIGLGTRHGLAGIGGKGAGGAAGDGRTTLAPFGVPGGGAGHGPKSPFMGISGNARKVVYICDASGSMMSVKDRVSVELRNAVSVLKPIQAFNVIFSVNEDATPLSKTSLVMANPDNKRRAFALADSVTYAGPTNPLPAIRLAFQQQPDLIYLLTDGFEAVGAPQQVVEEFRKLNADKRVKVNAIMVRGSSDPLLEGLLRTIASDNGGVLKIVDRRDM